jgi:hypothetical protein
MSKMTEDKVESILDNLNANLSNGWLYYHCVKSLDKAYKNHRITCARFFFMGCYNACLNESILSLSKLFIGHQDSVSLPYLLDYARNNPKSFSLSTEARVIETVNESEMRLKQFDSLKQIIKFNRDKSLAHIDLQHITNPSEILKRSNINMNDVEACFREIHKIINSFMGLKKSSELYLANIDSDVPGDLEFILGLIEKSDLEED